MQPFGQAFINPARMIRHRSSCSLTRNMMSVSIVRFGPLGARGANHRRAGSTQPVDAVLLPDMRHRHPGRRAAPPTLRKTVRVLGGPRPGRQRGANAGDGCGWPESD
jgi:hypothetical protein